jgi:hypothetical protein
MHAPSYPLTDMRTQAQTALLQSANKTHTYDHPTPTHAHVQGEFRYYMDDAGSKLLVVGRGGNAAAEAAGGVPALGIAIHTDDSGAPMEGGRGWCLALRFVLRIQITNDETHGLHSVNVMPSSNF